jgi:hypothetical protein
MGVDARAAAEHAVHQLSRPSTVACVETSGPAIERRIEQITIPEIGTNLRRGDARIGDGASAVDGNSTGRPMALILWHTN